MSSTYYRPNYLIAKVPESNQNRDASLVHHILILFQEPNEEISSQKLLLISSQDFKSNFWDKQNINYLNSCSLSFIATNNSCDNYYIYLLYEIKNAYHQDETNNYKRLNTCQKKRLKKKNLGSNSCFGNSFFRL